MATKNKLKKATNTVAKKAKKLANETVDTAKNNPKTILAVAGLVIAGFVVVGVYKKIFPPEKTLDQLSDDNDFSPTGLSDANAKLIADRLYAAMVQVGTNEDEIFSAVEGLNVNDFNKVYKAFGLRQYSLFWGNVGDPFTSDKHDLITWLTNELSDNDLNKLRTSIPGLNF